MDFKKTFTKSIKILLWTTASVLVLLLLLALLIQIPAVQNKIKDKAVVYLQEKIRTKVVIGNIDIGFPKNVILNNVYFEDQQKDTLLYGDKIAADISLFKLIDNQLEINSIDLKGINANIKRTHDSVYNFDYIIKAFASKEKKNSKAMVISLSKVNLDKINFKFDDIITKNNLKIYFNHFDAKVDKFDVEKLYFEIPSMNLDGLNMRLKQDLIIEKIVKATKELTDPDLPNPLKLKLGTIALSNIDFGYKSPEDQLNTEFTLKKLFVKVKQFDIQEEIIDLVRLDVDLLKSAVTIGKKSKRRAASEGESPSTNWKVKLDKANLKEVDFRFDDLNSIPVKRGMDYMHLDLKKIHLDGEKLNYTSKNLVTGIINELSGQEKSGLNVQSLKTEFYYTDKTVSLKKLHLKTPQTDLKNQITISYPSIAYLKKNVYELGINASVIGSHVGFKDILIFAPELIKINPFKSNPSAIMKINSTVSGKLNNIQIPNMEISGIGSTKIAGSGRIIGLPNTKKTYFDLKIRNLQSTSNDVNQFIPKGTIPNTIQLPSQFAVKGVFMGTIDDFFTNLNLASSYGAAKVKGNFNQKRKNAEKYKGDAEFNNFDIGSLIKNKDLGRITLNAKINGVGLNPKTATAKVIGKVTSAEYNKYTYRNADLDGDIKNGIFNAALVMKDPNLTFDLVSNGSFKDKYPAVKVKMNVDIADLEKLNLHAGPLKLKGQMDADLSTADIDYLNGNIDVHHLRFANAKEEFILDSINIVATAAPDKNTIILKSQFVEADVTGKYQLSTIASTLTNSLEKYYDTNPLAKKPKTEPQHFAFNLSVTDNPLLFQLMPDLKSLEPISITGRYNTVNDSIVLNGNIPKINYNGNTISNAVIKIDTKDKALVYSLIIDDIQNTQLQLPFTSLTGSVKDNIADYTLQLKDLKNKERYLIAGKMKAINKNSELHLNDKLVLNYDPWNMDPKNLIRIGKDGIYANAVALSKDGSSISLQSISDTPNAPLSIDFKDFKIETITNVIQKKDWAVEGTMNGNAVLKDLDKNAVFTSDLVISGLSFRKETIGTVNIKMDNQTANTYKANITITGQGNQVNLDGNYRSDNSALDMDLNMEKLNLKSIQGFSMDNLTESSGFFSGKFKIKGTAKEPKVVGDLQFNEIAFRVKKFNSYFKSMNDKVAVDENGISFDNFTVTDEENNVLLIDGKIATSNYTDYGFNLSVDADNFRALNSKEKDNNLFYGQLYLNSRLKVKGDINKPIVDGRIKINKGTKLTVVLPQSDPSVIDREGIVEFIDQDNPESKNMLIAADTISHTKFKGIEALVNIEIDKEAELSLIIDKGNGDYLKLKGEARLTGGIDASGKTTLTGRYEFTEGTYEMTFNVLKRKFDIKEGSYILWTGEPTTADISVTAVYKTNAAPIDLIGDQLGEITPEVRNTYKQKIPFETNLIMKGDLMKPDITFDIVLPEGNNSVATEIINATQTKLAQLRQNPSELNKQVFALLLLNRFIGENPFASEAGGTSTESLARQSASKILSQQLTNIAGDMIKGVELDFDLESTDNYTTGQLENRTDLNVGLSKKLLDDRLKLTVGSTFGLEGQQQVNQEANTIAGDLSADYKLTKDGRYRIRAYRKNQYQVALQGQVIETGVGFIITMNYNKFKELFKKSKEKKSRLKERKREEQKKKKKNPI